jgi:hypothetical protein
VVQHSEGAEDEEGGAEFVGVRRKFLLSLCDNGQLTTFSSFPISVEAMYPRLWK